MAVAELTLFGGFEVKLAGQVVDLPGQKDRALLAILALPPGAVHSRDKLASLLWGERGDQQARDSLKHGLTRLRQCLQPVTPAPIVADRQSVRLDATGVTIDVATFERLLGGGAPEALEQATALYRGDLLDGIGLRDPAFEDWLLVERQRLRHRAEEALAELIAQSLATGARERAATAARRLLSLDPLRESACRALMQTHVERAGTAQALKVYETLRDRLHRELGVKPEAETTRLYESIRQQRAAPTSSPESLHTEADSPPKPEAVDLPLPSRPSIAVLPFLNLSGDPEQEYFADGMVEEIIGALSRLRWLFVIARNSSFTYKGRAVDVKRVGRELGVRYVLEGSVRKSGNRVRIAGELIDTSTGANLWADRFEGNLEDVFDLQDQVTASAVGAIAPKLEQAEIERAKRKPTSSLDAYDYYLRGMAAVHLWTREGNKEALAHFHRAIELDPSFTSAYGMAARCYSQRKAAGWVVDRKRDVAEAEQIARRAVELGKEDALALATAGNALAYVVGDFDDGAAFIDQAITLNPNLAWGWLYSGYAKVWLGESDAAMERVNRAMRLSPQDSQFFNMQAAAAGGHFVAGRYVEALSWAEAAVRGYPNYLFSNSVVAVSAALAGRPEVAQKAVTRLRRIQSQLRISDLMEIFPLRRPEHRAKWAEGLRMAGIAE